jgi:transcriptional regulator GlxA family with amidase domain
MRSPRFEAIERSRRWVASVADLLDENPRLGGSELAAALKVSHATLIRMFRILTGISLVEYRNRLRLYRFETLLERRSLKMRDAALEAGFGSYAQFYRVIRAQALASPRDYARRRATS